MKSGDIKLNASGEVLTVEATLVHLLLNDGDWHCAPWPERIPWRGRFAHRLSLALRGAL